MSRHDGSGYGTKLARAPPTPKGLLEVFVTSSWSKTWGIGCLVAFGLSRTAVAGKRLSFRENRLWFQAELWLSEFWRSGRLERILERERLTCRPRLEIANRSRPRNLRTGLSQCFSSVLMCSETIAISVCQKRVPKALGVVGSGWCKARTSTFPRISSECKILREWSPFVAGMIFRKPKWIVQSNQSLFPKPLSPCPRAHVFASVGLIVNSDPSFGRVSSVGASGLKWGANKKFYSLLDVGPGVVHDGVLSQKMAQVDSSRLDVEHFERMVVRIPLGGIGMADRQWLAIIPSEPLKGTLAAFLIPDWMVYSYFPACSFTSELKVWRLFPSLVVVKSTMDSSEAVQDFSSKPILPGPMHLSKVLLICAASADPSFTEQLGKISDNLLGEKGIDSTTFHSKKLVGFVVFMKRKFIFFPGRRSFSPKYRDQSSSSLTLVPTAVYTLFSRPSTGIFSSSVLRPKSQLFQLFV
ncbi:hypothetical protein CRG98_000308 [Punica granatum]|uniref:Uncharacterized protein n=1 Tax=Punica granatum TaxID=22663 RepID=A0A2I0LF35_PUNGR|nr:hypothetical protein CRG98_000308 [Punica granatum]